MDRKALKNLTHNAKDFLSVNKNDYKQWVFRYTFLELEKDLGLNGDITTDSVINGDPLGVGVVIANEDGIMAGLSEVRYFLVDSDPRFKPRLSTFEVEFFIEDGDALKAGDKILEIKGKVKDILAVERICLNLLMRMSGVASFTKELVLMLEDTGLDTLITPTRKTLWGLLDKKAVILGGGGTHRLNLGDAILVKDNHLSILGGSISTAIKNISEARPEARFIEIEVDDKDSALKAAEALVSFVSHKGIESPACILLDNMSPSEILSILDDMKRKEYYDKILFEASGNIKKDNLLEYAKTGVDIVSMGCLTMASRSLDFSLEIS